MPNEVFYEWKKYNFGVFLNNVGIKKTPKTAFKTPKHRISVSNFIKNTPSGPQSKTNSKLELLRLTRAPIPELPCQLQVSDFGEEFVFVARGQILGDGLVVSSIVILQ